MDKKGIFITLEGADGAGKSTAAKAVYNYILNVKHKACVYTREPGGCIDAENIREVIVNPHMDCMDEQTKLLLVLAARRIHIQDFIIPSLLKGCNVICDRFIDSTQIYQGCIGGQLKTIDMFKTSDAYADTFIRPDYTFFLDVDSSVARKRLSNRDNNNKLDDHYGPKMKKINEEFRKHFNHLSDDKIIVIDSNQSQENVLKDIFSKIDYILGNQDRLSYTDRCKIK